MSGPLEVKEWVLDSLKPICPSGCMPDDITHDEDWKVSLCHKCGRVWPDRETFYCCDCGRPEFFCICD
jgi:hypothetical protein